MKNKHLFTKPTKSTITYISVIILLSLSLICISYKSGYISKVLIKLDVIQEDPHSNDAYRSWAKCLNDLNYTANIAFVGDSITANGNWGEYFPDKKVCNLGCYGDSILNVRERINVVKSVNPEKIFIMCGINSLASRSVKQCVEQYKLMLEEYSSEFTNSEIYVLSVLPTASSKHPYADNSDIVSFNAQIKTIAEEMSIQYIDIYSAYEKDGCLPSEYSQDGLHITSDYYCIWVEHITEYVY